MRQETVVSTLTSDAGMNHSQESRSFNLMIVSSM